MVKQKSKIGILGYGEVGQAMAKFYSNPLVKDLKRDDGLEGVEVLHICFPWRKDFLKIAKEEICKARPQLAIIHSTVPVGTTKKLYSTLPSGNRCSLVHSPIRGVHPKLYKGIKTFVKYVGADQKRAGLMAQKHLNSVGINAKMLGSSAVTEALKLWDTTQYAWMIILNKEMKSWCKKNKLDFNAIYSEANITYNKGYQKLGRPDVLRPSLRHIPGPIGGHCLIPNCNLLDSEISRYILEKNKKYKSEK